MFSGELEPTHERCILCWSNYRLERDHINEVHGDNFPSNIRILCKFHHSQKGLSKLGGDLFQQLLSAVGKDAKMRRTMRFYAEKAMLEYSDAEKFPFRNKASNDDDSDLYTKNELTNFIAEIAEKPRTYSDYLDGLDDLITDGHPLDHKRS